MLKAHILTVTYQPPPCLLGRLYSVLSTLDLSTLSLNVIGVLSDLGTRNEKVYKAVPFMKEIQIEELRWNYRVHETAGVAGLAVHNREAPCALGFFGPPQSSPKISSSFHSLNGTNVYRYMSAVQETDLLYTLMDSSSRISGLVYSLTPLNRLIRTAPCIVHILLSLHALSFMQHTSRQVDIPLLFPN